MEQVKTQIASALSRDLILDLYDAVSARALAAHEMIRDHAGLDDKRQRIVEGRVRFPMQERSFEEVCQQHSGHRLDCEVIPGTDLRFFQPFYRFPGEPHGVILGFASMPEQGRLPAENMSRKAGVSLNFHLAPGLDFDGSGPKSGDIYVLFLVARDPMRAGHVAEVAIGVVNSGYDSFLFYEDVEGFFASYSDVADEDGSPSSIEETGSLVKLKPGAVPFQAPESESAANETEGDGKAEA